MVVSIIKTAEITFGYKKIFILFKLKRNRLKIKIKKFKIIFLKNKIPEEKNFRDYILLKTQII